MCGLEVRTLSKSDDILAVWEGKILRKIPGPVKETGVGRICTNQELMYLSRGPDIISEVEKEDSDG